MRALQAQVAGSETRLDALAADEASPLGEIARELQRVEDLRTRLTEARSLHAGLERRARELRAAWFRR